MQFQLSLLDFVKSNRVHALGGFLGCPPGEWGGDDNDDDDRWTEECDLTISYNMISAAKSI